MNELFIMNIILTFVFILLYLGFSFSQELSKKDTFYGIYLEEQYKNDKTLKAVSKTFKWQSFLVFLITSLLSLMYININKNLNNPLIILIPLFVQLFLYFAIYIHAYKNVKAFKRAYVQDNASKLHKTVIDTEFIKEKNSLKNLFIGLYSVPILVALFLTIYVLLEYDSLPDKIPTHWNYLGQIDAWTAKSYTAVLFPNIMQIAIILLMAFTTVSIFTSRSKLSTNNLEESKSNTLKYLKGMAFSIYLITLFILVVFCDITFGLIKGSNIQASFLWISLIGPVLGIAVMLYSFLKYGNKSSRSGHSQNSYSPEDDDTYWLWGSFYNNPNDPAVMVEKRYGMGWTINIGNKKGKILLILLIIFILATLITPFILPS